MAMGGRGCRSHIHKRHPWLPYLSGARRIGNAGAEEVNGEGDGGIGEKSA